MGQEIEATHFRRHDFRTFERGLAREMRVLREWFSDKSFSSHRSIGGLELEGWLVSADGVPVPLNEPLLRTMGCDGVVSELSRFNVEFNVIPEALARRGIERLGNSLDSTWTRCDDIASTLGASVIAIGILPTIEERQLSLETISTGGRYRALNEQVMRLHEGRPFRLEISGREALVLDHRDVMLEAAATSFQIHRQVNVAEAARVYNASQIASSIMVAISANSPWLFGRALWEETRIPLFEQAVAIGEAPYQRVSFGTGYAKQTLLEVFEENERHYPLLLPFESDQPEVRMPHVRLHNGTIWRWNRPLIGFDPDGTPHLRIEHRVPAASPTCIDLMADMALFHGLVESLANCHPAPETRLPWSVARDNFYQAARLGFQSSLTWLDGQTRSFTDTFMDHILPAAAAGLVDLNVDADLRDRLLGIVSRRVAVAQQGATWQRRFVERYGRDFRLLTREYRVRQREGHPVHTWTL